MSWLFSNELNELIEKATSEMIPAGQDDMALNLDICDRIRSKQVNPKEAMRSLKKRISHKNPNVQLLALKLSDLCVKNGGPHFLAEIASREFIDSLVSLVSSNTTNYEVKNRILALIQSWAHAFQNRSELGYVADTLNSLRYQGYDFPPAEKTDAIMVDTTAAPDWTDSSTCERCRALFSLTNRKHHCRNCGKTYCNDCSSKSIALPHFGINQEVRVCEACFQRISGGATVGGKPSGSRDDLAIFSGASTAQQQITGAISREDEELQRAIALSLLESERRNRPANDSGKRVQFNDSVTVVDEAGDPELAAAIAASLKEAAAAKKAQEAPVPPSVYPSSTSANAAGAAVSAASSSSVAASAGTVADEVSKTEMQNINLFSQLIEKIDADPSGQSAANLANDRELRKLYDAQIAIHPKIVKGISDCVERHKQLMDLHDKLTQAVHTYDRLVEERAQAAKAAAAVMTAQQQHQAYAYPPPAHQQPATYGQPPTVAYGGPYGVAAAGYPGTAVVAPPPVNAYGYAPAQPPAHHQTQQPAPTPGYYSSPPPPAHHQPVPAVQHPVAAQPHPQQQQQQPQPQPQYYYGGYPGNSQSAVPPAAGYASPPPQQQQQQQYATQPAAPGHPHSPPKQQQQQQPEKPLIEF